MWFEALALGMVVGIIRGGRLVNLNHRHFKGVMLIIAGVLLQLVPFFLHGFAFVKTYASYFSVAGLVLALVALVLNLNKSGLWLVGLGALLQGVTLVFNQWKMPIKLAGQTAEKYVQMSLAIESGEISNYILFADTGHWTKYLGKVVVLPDFYPFTSSLGLPDLLILIGMVWFISSELQTTRFYRSNSPYSRRRY